MATPLHSEQPLSQPPFNATPSSGQPAGSSASAASLRMEPARDPATQQCQKALAAADRADFEELLQQARRLGGEDQRAAELLESYKEALLSIGVANDVALLGLDDKEFLKIGVLPGYLADMCAPFRAVQAGGNAVPTEEDQLKAEMKQGLHALCTALLRIPVDPAAAFMMLPEDLPDVLPVALRTSIYIRDLYRQALKMLDASTEKSALVVTGHPGVGKSAMAPLVVHHLAHKGYCIIYADNHDTMGRMLYKMDFRVPGTITVDVKPDRGWQRQIWAGQTKTLLICNGQAPDAHYGGRTWSLILASSSCQRWRKYRKGSGGSHPVRVLYMDIWMPYEIEAARAQLYSNVPAAVAADRYVSFGGSVRLVLADQATSFDEVEPLYGAEQVEHLVNMELMAFCSSASHFFIHLRAGVDFKLKYFQLASHRVAALVLKLLSRQEVQRVRQMLLGSAGQTSMGGWCSMLFAAHGHMVVPGGVTVYQRQLTKPAQAARKKKRKAATCTTVPVKKNRMAATDSAVPVEEAEAAAENMAHKLPYHLRHRTIATHHYAADLHRQPLAWATDYKQLFAAMLSQPLPPTTNQSGQRSDAPQQPAAMQPNQAISPSWVDGLSQGSGHLNQREDISGQEVTLPIVPTVWDVPETDLIALGDYYLRPLSTNNPAWDAVLCTKGTDGARTLYILQYYTLSASGNVCQGAILELLDRLQPSAKDSIKMVFVVPDSPDNLYEDFRYQSWLRSEGSVLTRPDAAVLALEQWVVRLPFSPSIKIYSPAGSMVVSSSGAAAHVQQQEAAATGKTEECEESSEDDSKEESEEEESEESEDENEEDE